MNTTTNTQLKDDIRRTSKVMGIGEKELAERALRFYLASIKEEVALQDEFSAWEQVSDEALLKMEKSA